MHLLASLLYHLQPHPSEKSFNTAGLKRCIFSNEILNGISIETEVRALGNKPKELLRWFLQRN
jgi:hypothetical protein